MLLTALGAVSVTTANGRGCGRTADLHPERLNLSVRVIRHSLPGPRCVPSRRPGVSQRWTVAVLTPTACPPADRVAPIAPAQAI